MKFPFQRCSVDITSRWHLLLQAISFVDRAYIYDNSRDNELPQLLYRTTDGHLIKKYSEDIPEWAASLVLL